MSRGWPRPARPRKKLRLELDAIGDDADAVRNLSAATRVGGSLFVAADERAAIDSLTGRADGSWGDHRRFELKELLDLAAPDEEVDIEGLAAEGGWLWVVGSHARTRPKPKKSEGRIDLGKLAQLNDTRPRCVLARLPLAEDEGVMTPVRRDGERRAGMVKQTAKGNKLAALMRKDPLLKPFAPIPAKEGGIDIEGIAVCGDRLALGMRGPVIRDYALLLEARWSARKSGRLHLEPRLAKRLLDLEGLGIRDLKRCGEDLLILAGPTTGLDGPCALYRWNGWAGQPGSGADVVELHHPERIVELPFGRGCDHPEGLALSPDGSQVLVLYDSPAEQRVEGDSIMADLFDLPSR